MFKKTLLAVIVLPFMVAPVLAENTNAHHYQGGPKTTVPHHMTDWPKSGETTAVGDQSGQHHYRGGPKAEPHHIGNWPGATGEAPKVSNKATKAKRKHQARRHQTGSKS